MNGLTFQISDRKLLEIYKNAYYEVETENIEDYKILIDIILGVYHRQENA